MIYKFKKWLEASAVKDFLNWNFITLWIFIMLLNFVTIELIDNIFVILVLAFIYWVFAKIYFNFALKKFLKLLIK